AAPRTRCGMHCQARCLVAFGGRMSDIRNISVGDGIGINAGEQTGEPPLVPPAKATSGPRAEALGVQRALAIETALLRLKKNLDDAERGNPKLYTHGITYKRGTHTPGQLVEMAARWSVWKLQELIDAYLADGDARALGRAVLDDILTVKVFLIPRL